MYCRKCGAKISENDPYCPKCGANTNPYALNEKKNSSSEGGVSKIMNDWNAWSGPKKALSVVFCCSLALIIIFSAASLIPDNNMGGFLNNSDSNHTINSAFISDFMNNTSNVSDDTRIPVENNSNDSGAESSGIRSFGGISDSASVYVGSVNSNKFHNPHCSQAGKIKDSNRIYFSSRDDAISNGYDPCQLCNP